MNFLKHEKIVKKDPTELLRWNPSLLPIYGGFPCLTDLHLAKNAIKDIDALVAIICFKSLKSVFLESNPVMLTYHVRQRDPDEFNLFLHLDKSYGIRISDPIFKKQNEILDRIKFKQSHLLAQPRKKAIPAVLGQKANPHHVSAMSSQKLTKQRKMRRKYKFTEDDVKQVIASGKIPSMRALLRKRKEEKKLADAIEDENDNYQSSNFSFHPEIQDQTFMTSVHITQEDDQASLSIQDDDGSMLSWSEPEESESEEEDVPDFNLPSTIQGSIKALQHALNNPVSYWRIMENSYLKPTHSTIAKAYLKSWDQEFKIPKNDVREMEEEESETASIKSSLSSGKMSHNNNTPWLDEEIEEEFFLIPQKSLNVQTYYAKEGHMSYLSKSELQARPDLINAQSHYVKEGSMSYLSKQDLDLINANSSRRQSSLGISRRSSLAVKGLTHDFRLRQVQKAAAQRRASELKIQLKSLRRARDEGRLRPKDEFEEMNELMNEVEEKVKSVEARLGNFKSNAGNVLKSKSIESHIPKSTKALSNLQREYSRIAALYITDAERIVQQEPLSARLQKLGMDKKH